MAEDDLDAGLCGEGIRPLLREFLVLSVVDGDGASGLAVGASGRSGGSSGATGQRYGCRKAENRRSDPESGSHHEGSFSLSWLGW